MAFLIALLRHRQMSLPLNERASSLGKRTDLKNCRKSVRHTAVPYALLRDFQTRVLMKMTQQHRIVLWIGNLSSNRAPLE